MFTKLAAVTAVLTSLLAMSVAPALASPEFEAASKWIAEGTGSQHFSLGEGIEGECGGISVEGVSPKGGRSSKALLKPKYTKCTSDITGIKKVITIATGECEYELYNLTGASPFTAESNLVNCKGGIIATRGTCVVTIPEQGGLKAGQGHNIKTTKGAFESEATADLIGFKFTVNTACEELGLKAGKEGSYIGSGIAKGLIVV